MGDVDLDTARVTAAKGATCICWGYTVTIANSRSLRGQPNTPHQSDCRLVWSIVAAALPYHPTDIAQLSNTSPAPYRTPSSSLGHQSRTSNEPFVQRNEEEMRGEGNRRRELASRHAQRVGFSPARSRHLAMCKEEPLTISERGRPASLFVAVVLFTHRCRLPLAIDDGLQLPDVRCVHVYTGPPPGLGHVAEILLHLAHPTSALLCASAIGGSMSPSILIEIL